MGLLLHHIKRCVSGFFAPIRIEYHSHQYVPGFDGWRGVGAILVIAAHCFPSVITRPFWVAMDMFFVLSGFLITGILLDSRSNRHYYRNYLTRRVLRVFPLYYFALALLFLIIPWIAPDLLGPGYRYYLKHQAWFWLYAQNWLYSITGFPDNHTLTHFWSLAVEEQFYLLWPFLVKIVSPKKLVKVCLGIIAFSIYFRMSLGFRLGLVLPYPYVCTLARMDAISLGAIIAILIRYHKKFLEKYVSWGLLISVIFSVAGVIYYRSASFLRAFGIFTFVDLFFCCLLLYSLRTSKGFILRFAEARPFRFLGKYSYGIYIYHYIIFNILYHNLSLSLVRYFGRPWISEIIIAILTFTFSVLVSVASFNYLEKPFLNLKRYFTYDGKTEIKRPVNLPEVSD